jgi:hypothetical protein
LPTGHHRPMKHREPRCVSDRGILLLDRHPAPPNPSSRDAAAKPGDLCRWANRVFDSYLNDHLVGTAQARSEPPESLAPFCASTFPPFAPVCPSTMPSQMRYDGVELKTESVLNWWRELYWTSICRGQVFGDPPPSRSQDLKGRVCGVWTQSEKMVISGRQNSASLKEDLGCQA